jgi:hypothetical protein
MEIQPNDGPVAYHLKILRVIGTDKTPPSCFRYDGVGDPFFDEHKAYNGLFANESIYGPREQDQLWTKHGEGGAAVGGVIAADVTCGTG